MVQPFRAIAERNAQMASVDDLAISDLVSPSAFVHSAVVIPSAERLIVACDAPLRLKARFSLGSEQIWFVHRAPAAGPISSDFAARI